MAWVRLDDSMVDHPKIDPLSDAAFRWLHRGLSYANRFLTNGKLPIAFLEKVPGPIVAELTTARVWDRGRDGTLRIHDFTKYQSKKADVERAIKLNKERQAKWRHKNNGESNGVTDGVPNGVTAALRQREPNSAPTQPLPTSTKIPPKPPRRRTPKLSQAKLDQADRNNADLNAFIAANKK